MFDYNFVYMLIFLIVILMEGKYEPKSEFEREVRGFVDGFGGILNAHIHGDRAYTRREKYYESAGISISDMGRFSLPEKQRLTWVLHKGPAFDPDCIEMRMRRMIDESIYFGVNRIWTTVDVTHNNELKSLEVAEKLKAEYAGRVDLSIGAYNPSGFKNGDEGRKRFELFEEAAGRADFLMGLAEKDRKGGHIGESQHNWYMLNLAHRFGKPVHFHVGQENRPTDNTLELLLDDLADVQDKHLRISPEDFPDVYAVHCISSSCKSQKEFDETAEKMSDRNVGLICCPRAAISMYQDSSHSAPIHNSIAKVWDFAVRGVRVGGLGVDNLDDIYVPASSADVFDEAEDVANSLRFYNARIVAKLMSGEPLDPFDCGTIERELFAPNK